MKTVYIRESEVFEEMRCGRFDLRANFTQRFNESLRRVMMRTQVLAAQCVHLQVVLQKSVFAITTLVCGKCQADS